MKLPDRFESVFHTERESERERERESAKERLTMQNTTASKWLHQRGVCPDLTQVHVLLYVNFILSVYCGLSKTGKASPF